MGRRRQRKAAAIRQGQTDLCLVAGLPNSILQGVLNRLEARFPKHTFKGTPSRQADGQLYTQAVVEKLLAEAASFAIRRRRGSTPEAVSPASIVLAYVPGPDEEVLLSAFDFCVMPAPLRVLAAFAPENGRQYRHHADTAYEAVVAAIGRGGEAKLALDEVKQRVARHLNDSEVLFLPPINFHVGADRRLGQLFLEFRRGDRPATDRFLDLVIHHLDGDDIERLGSDVRHCRVDNKRRAFLNAHPTAYDGSEWTVDEADATAAKLQPVLRSLYRFGAPLPDGFHHDVQFADGSRFQKSDFDCGRAGQVTFTCPYVNIYPDDFIRPGKAQLARKGRNKNAAT